ncbi:MAG: DinB family protein [Phycisphaerae bacterium]|nr:DinB family protein [Phycisphaerae bacterium]NNF42784.1 DinB family protein [Phycisphaerales bacterium]
MTTTTANVDAATLNFIRSWFDKLIETIPADKMFYQPVPTANHAAWILGHCAWCDDAFASSLFGTEATIPAEWKDMFGYGSEPSADASKYPAPAELKQAFVRCRETLMKQIEAMDDAKRSEPLPEDWAGFAPNYGALAAAIASHEGVHLGQLTVIRKGLGMKPAMM